MTPARQHYRNLSSEPWTLAATAANVCRLIFAVLWTLLWGTARFIDNCLHHPDWAIVTLHAMAFSWGRRESPKAMWCECGWVGPLRWAIHTYQDDCAGDVDPVDECRRCGCDSLHPVLMRRNGAWGS